MEFHRKYPPALYLERSLSVDALGIRVAAPVVGQALVDVPALDPITYEALVASALVRTLSVLALGELAAGVRVQETLVVVGATRACVRFHGIPLFAATVEGADGVVAFTVAANVGLRRAFVHIWEHVKFETFLLHRDGDNGKGFRSTMVFDCLNGNTSFAGNSVEDEF